MTELYEWPPTRSQRALEELKVPCRSQRVWFCRKRQDLEMRRRQRARRRTSRCAGLPLPTDRTLTVRGHEKRGSAGSEIGSDSRPAWTARHWHVVVSADPTAALP